MGARHSLQVALNSVSYDQTMVPGNTRLRVGVGDL
jgi:hypothetical protein